MLANGKELEISISIGVAVYPDDTGQLTKLLEIADMALYRAKRNGRGRVAASAGEER
ncbi:MAG TPA: diguanylate cyclase [Firmicutes bacterium]|nr:diguanylate cyclase [Bacillota bacterium]